MQRHLFNAQQMLSPVPGERKKKLSPLAPRSVRLQIAREAKNGLDYVSIA